MNNVIDFVAYRKEKELKEFIKNSKISYTFPTLYLVIKDGKAEWSFDPPKNKD